MRNVVDVQPTSSASAQGAASASAASVATTGGRRFMAFLREADSVEEGQRLLVEVIDEAVFSLPINRLSRRLEDERGFHIVRVLERQEARQIPFEEAQKEIKEAINKERRSAKFKEVLESLKKGTTIWTIYDEEDAAAKEKAAQAAAEGAAAER